MARDHPDVHVDGLGPAHALELTFLEHAQELDLHRGGDIADLVEEERAAIGQLEPPLAPGGRRR